ncbi:MAG: serine/threonine protein kinase [Deinococcota bacterium]|nr:serine/threonine protein kinase [Deinococcota bacterium]
MRVLSSSGPMRVELAQWHDRLVVVKRLQGFSHVLEARLRREASVVKKLQHDNIIPLLATEGDRIIYAYCSGMSLAEALRGGTIRPKRAVRIAADVLRALDYAHGMNVIHCDVKPSNIMIKGDKALLTDFGFAKDLAMTAITAPGMLLGTPNYMAPEQFRGDRSDPRSDLYAVGAVLFHMLTGAPPYGSQALRFLAGDDRLTLAPLQGEAEPLEGAIGRALSRDPKARFESAAEMLRALAEVHR